MKYALEKSTAALPGDLVGEGAESEAAERSPAARRQPAAIRPRIDIMTCSLTFCATG